MNIHFLEPARIELDDAIAWYELEQENLGKRFLREIQFALKRIVMFPDSMCVYCARAQALYDKKVPLYADLRH